jgi:hypothetical protein
MTGSLGMTMLMEVSIGTTELVAFRKTNLQQNCSRLAAQGSWLEAHTRYA